MANSLAASALVIGAACAMAIACRDTSAHTTVAPSSAVSTGASAPTDEEACVFTERLRRALFVRTAADNYEHSARELDPLLSRSSYYLLASPRYDEIESMLIELDARNLIPRDPLRRAILERDLWAIFDWLVQTGWSEWSSSSRLDPTPQLRVPRARHLASVLGRALKRVAPIAAEIDALPDNFNVAAASRAWPSDVVDEPSNDAFLPTDLLDPSGPWIELQSSDYEPLTPLHDEAFGFRSVFSVHLRLPGGRDATLDYIRRLREFPDPLVRNDELDRYQRQAPEWERVAGWRYLNPDAPQFPVGTEVALVRRMALFDDAGRLHLSGIVESVQIRRFRKIGPAVVLYRMNAEPSDQHMVEFVLDRDQLFDGKNGGLRAVARDETRQLSFLTYDFDGQDLLDPLHPPRVLDTCFACHAAPGIFSMVSYTRIPGGAGSQLGCKTPRLPHQFLVRPPCAARDRGDDAKLRQFDWGVLQSLLSTEK